MAYENGLQLVNVSLGETTDVIPQYDLRTVVRDPRRFEAHMLRVSRGQEPEADALALFKRALGQPFAEPSADERAVIEHSVRNDLLEHGLDDPRVAHVARLTTEQVTDLILPFDGGDAA